MNMNYNIYTYFYKLNPFINEHYKEQYVNEGHLAAALKNEKM